MKKRYALVCIFVLVLSLFGMEKDRQLACAASKAEIYADKIILKSGDNIRIPVYIRNNPGVMGYVINVNYNEEKLKIREVSPGILCQNGIFDDNLSVSKGGKGEILWSYTKEIGEDGVVFYLDVIAKKELKKTEKIELRIEEEETFNEKYEALNICCNNIEISGGEKTVIEENEIKSEEKNETEKKQETKEEKRQREVSEKKGKERKKSKSNGSLNVEISKKKEEKNVDEPESISGKSIKLEETVGKKKSTAAEEEKQSQPVSGVEVTVLILLGLTALFLVKNRKKVKTGGKDK